MSELPDIAWDVTDGNFCDPCVIIWVLFDLFFRRYNCERLCTRLGRVKRFHNWREPIPEGYFPKLDSLVASRTWPARPAGAVLKDINRPVDQLNFDLQDLERWRDRIYEAIHTGAYISPRGERVPLTEFGGIDVLGNMMEASILSPNQNVYGDLHNLGHVAISYCHDPDHRYLVMGYAIAVINCKNLDKIKIARIFIET